MFERNELIELRKKSVDMAETKGLNKCWKRAYLNLADAADRLDAMIERSTVHFCGKCSKKLTIKENENE